MQVCCSVKNRVPEECIFTCPHFLKSLLIVSRPVHVSHCFPTLALNSFPQWPLQSPSGPKTCCSKMDGFIVVIFIGLKHNLTNHGKFGGFHGFSHHSSALAPATWRRRCMKSISTRAPRNHDAPFVSWSRLGCDIWGVIQGDGVPSQACAQLAKSVYNIL